MGHNTDCAESVQRILPPMAGNASPWMEFPEFRQYEAVRQEANNAMMALLAGSKLAAHTLQLTAGSSRLLPEIFPGVEHVSYFNLRTDAATKLLADTGHHLGAVTVPYALAVHEDFVMTVLDLLSRFGYRRKAPGDTQDSTRNRVTAWNMHESLWMTLGRRLPPRGSVLALEQFHLLREMRNAQIHAGGTISARLSQEVTDITPEAATAWKALSRRAPTDVIATDPLRFTTFDIFAVFATTKTLGRTVNHLLRDSLPARQWAEICLEDYSALTSKSSGSDQWMRGLIGHAAMNYAAGSVSEQDIIDAAVAAGAWPAGRAWTRRRASRGTKRARVQGTGPPNA